MSPRLNTETSSVLLIMSGMVADAQRAIIEQGDSMGQHNNLRAIAGLAVLPYAVISEPWLTTGRFESQGEREWTG